MMFVCTGNICRSPFAEHYARSVWPTTVTVSSSGTSAIAGMSPTDHMMTVGRESGLDLRQHSAAPLGAGPTPSLVYAMERHHLRAVRAAFPDLDPSAVRLLPGGEIEDPYGGDIATYRTCASSIMKAIDEIDLSDVIGHPM